MTENIAVVTPTPSASVITTTVVNPGFLPSCRSAYRSVLEQTGHVSFILLLVPQCPSSRGCQEWEDHRAKQ
jgi:hypothetical protein